MFLSSLNGVIPNNNDIYDPESPWLGNSNLRESYIQSGTCKSYSNEMEMIDW